MNLLFLQGVLIGFLASVSFGPAAYIIIQKTINVGKFRGIIAGLGVASIDTIFAIIAAFSVSSSINFIESYQIYFRLVGGLIIVGIGIKIILTKSSLNNHEHKSKLMACSSDFISTFFIALFNPLTVLMYALLLTTLNIIPKERDILQLFELFVGVFIGTNIWWNLIVFSASYIRSHLHFQRLQWLNKTIGSFVLLAGLFILVSIFVKF